MPAQLVGMMEHRAVKGTALGGDEVNGEANIFAGCVCCAGHTGNVCRCMFKTNQRLMVPWSSGQGV